MSNVENHAFQAEIRQLLDIVIHSLYTDREVFVRELISNAADACEKLRFLQSGGATTVFEADRPPAITVTADEAAGTITIADSGIGMTRAELVDNLGTIAHSGTKAFLQRLAEGQKADARLIGQFGVGFYSAFMVARRVVVRTRSHVPEESAWVWSSEGGGGYQLEPGGEQPRGTQITLELKDDAKNFAVRNDLEAILRRYSNFVPFPLELNGARVNTVQAIWARNRNEVKEEEYQEFYRYISHDTDAPALRLHFSAEGPISVQALLFVPARNLESLGLVRLEPEVSLYCRKVLIQHKVPGLLPEWLRFVRGVIDSEDLPLNVSRERMQDSDRLKKLNRIVTHRFLKFLGEEESRDPAAYDRFYGQFGRFLKEGILSDHEHRDALAKLLRYESSGTTPGQMTSLEAYVQRMPPEQTEIYYLLAANRAAAEGSPCFEVFRARKYEVLFVPETADEFVLDRLHNFNGKPLVAAEKASVTVPDDAVEGALSADESKVLTEWLKGTLGEAVHEVRVSRRLVDSPAVALDADGFMTSSMRRTLKMMGRDAGTDLSQAPDLELNPRHPLVKQLHRMRESDADLAGKLAAQLADNARLAAGLLEDPRPMVKRLNELLERMAAGRPGGA